MAIERVNDPWAFRDFLDTTLVDRSANLTLDEAFELWEYENAPDEESRETIEAIHRGLTDVQTGRVRPIEAFDREFRAKHGLPTRQ